jgi:hypothetical protein
MAQPTLFDCLTKNCQSCYDHPSPPYLRRVTLKTPQLVVEKLHNAATTLPAVCSLFTPIDQHALSGHPDLAIHGPANSELQATILDIRTMVLRLGCRPLHVNELVPRPPGYLTYCDASAFGAGGVWFSGACPSRRKQGLCIVWPLNIQTRHRVLV